MLATPGRVDNPEGRSPQAGRRPERGTLEPLGSGPHKEENPDLFRARRQIGPAEGTAPVFGGSTAGEEALCLPHRRLVRRMLMVRHAGEGKKEQMLYSFQLWAINPFITSHVVNDESI